MLCVLSLIMVPARSRVAALKSVALWCSGVIMSAALLVLALPPAGFGVLGLFVLVPVLRAARGRGFLVGFVSSLAMIFLAAWIAEQGWFYSNRFEGGTNGWLYTGFGLFGFAIAMTVAIYADISRKKEPSIPLIASLAVLFESVLLLVLPAHLGLTQYRQPVAMMIATLGGIWLVSWLLWVLNLYLARLALPRTVIGFCVAAILWYLGMGSKFASGGNNVTVGMLQTEAVDLETLSKLHRGVGQTEVTVWPEFSGLAIAYEGDASDLIKLSRNSSPLVTTFRDNEAPLPHNAAALFSNGKESARYFKRKLFGSESQMHQAGVQAVRVAWSQGLMGLNICYDSCFPSIIRDTASNPAVNLIVLPTIDPPSPHAFVAAIHSAYTPFRCAESGVPMVRADGFAYSMAVDGRGRIVKELGLGESATATPLPIEHHWTLVSVAGDWVLFACCGVVLMTAFGSRRNH